MDVKNLLNMLYTSSVFSLTYPNLSGSDTPEKATPLVHQNLEVIPQFSLVNKPSLSHII